MALDPSIQDPCSILSATSYPTLWIPSTALDAEVFPKIATSGLPVRFLSAIGTLSTAGGLSASILVNQADSSMRLVQFLAGKGIGAYKIGGTQQKFFNQLNYVLLNSGTVTAPVYESIVDTYIMSSTGLGLTAYTFPPTVGTPLITDTQIWTTGDDAAPSPVSLLGKLLAKGYLLKGSQIYAAPQFAAGATVPTVATQSLVYIYKQAQSSTPLTPEQLNQQNTLETTNLRFFGAFLCEYCYYRTRYEWLLAKYFTVYTMPTTGSGTGAYVSPTDGFSVASLFTGQGTGITQYQNVSLSQADYLKGLAYHMAILNTRMTDMRRLLAAINTYYNGVFTTIQTALNSASIPGSNAELTSKIAALQIAADDTNGYLTQTEFTKSVMEYNSEKNRSSNILLGFYAFLNIAALATIFQLARTS